MQESRAEKQDQDIMKIRLKAHMHHNQHSKNCAPYLIIQ